MDGRVHVYNMINSGVEAVFGAFEQRPAKQPSSYTFKAHKKGDTMYPVNAICAHPNIPFVFSTVGSDGVNYNYYNGILLIIIKISGVLIVHHLNIVI